jgi:predicted nuclease with TOPRIM domain
MSLEETIGVLQDELKKCDAPRFAAVFHENGEVRAMLGAKIGSLALAVGDLQALLKETTDEAKRVQAELAASEEKLAYREEDLKKLKEKEVQLEEWEQWAHKMYLFNGDGEGFADLRSSIETIVFSSPSNLII